MSKRSINDEGLSDETAPDFEQDASNEIATNQPSETCDSEYDGINTSDISVSTDSEHPESRKKKLQKNSQRKRNEKVGFDSVAKEKRSQR